VLGLWFILSGVTSALGLAPNCPVVQEYTGHTDGVYDLLLIPFSFTLNGQERGANTTFLSGGQDSKVIMWDATSAAPNSKLREYFIGSYVNAVEVLPDSSFLAGTADKKIRLFGFGGSAASKTFTGHTGWISCIKYLGDGTFVSGSSDFKVIRWSMQEGTKLMTYSGHDFWVTTLELLKDGTFLSGSYDTYVKRWTATSPVEMEAYTYGNKVYTVAVVDESTFIAAGDGNVIWQFKVGTLTPVFKYKQAHSNRIRRLLSMGGAIISSGYDGFSFRWEIGRDDPVSKFIHGAGWIEALSDGGDGTFITGGTDKLIKRFNSYGNVPLYIYLLYGCSLLIAYIVSLLFLLIQH
jgi:WD40 repeat protein